MTVAEREPTHKFPRLTATRCLIHMTANVAKRICEEEETREEKAEEEDEE